MALGYILRDYKDIYTLENVGLVTLSYTLSKKECDSVTTIEEGDILAGQTITLPINYIDGVYSIEISDNIETLILPDILFYNNLLISIIDNVEEVVCGCKGCDTCDDCGDEECSLHLNTLIAVLAFNFMKSPKYNDYLDLVAEVLKCTIDARILCLITKQLILGKEDSKDLVLEIIALYYLAFYFKDLADAEDAEEVTYIKTKYNSVKILRCIRKMGIDIDAIENS